MFILDGCPCEEWDCSCSSEDAVQDATRVRLSQVLILFYLVNSALIWPNQPSPNARRFVITSGNVSCSVWTVRRPTWLIVRAT